MSISSTARKTVACLACLFLISIGSVPRHGWAQECPTQGAFALALAQILGFDVTYAESATRSLDGIGIKPDPEWTPDECLTAAVIPEIEADLKAAVNANLLDPRDVSGAVAYALDAIGAAGLIGQGMPSLYTRSVPHVAGPPLEGSRGELPVTSPPPPGPPPVPPPTTTTRPPASPFIP